MKPIKLSNPFLNIIFTREIPLTNGEIEQVLNLPRTETIADLQNILNHAIDSRATLYGQTLVVLHCVFLLTEMRSTESLPHLLRLCSQTDDFLDLCVDEHSTETMWQDIMTLGHENIEELFAFIKAHNSESMGVCIVSSGLAQIARHYPEKKNQIVDGLKEVLLYFYHERPAYKIDNSNWVMSAIADIKGIELLDTIKLFNDAGRLKYPLWKDVLSEINGGGDGKRELMSIRERYDHFCTPDIPLDKAVSDFMFLETPSSQAEYDAMTKKADTIHQMFEKRGLPPTVRGQSIGRNEPCICGSGKKYKNCCMD